jgi:hypothetical protein
MLCDTCRFSERPGFVKAGGRKDAGAQGNRDEMIPCPDCGGQGIGHCCDGICEQPELGTQQSSPVRPTGP